MLKQAKPEQFFYCADGSVLRSIQELENKLRTISSEAYGHHVNESKNDFHNWIRDVFQEPELASEIITAKTQAEAAGIVRKHLYKATQANAEIEKAIKSVLSVRQKTIVAAKKATKLIPKKTEVIVREKVAKLAPKKPVGIVREKVVKLAPKKPVGIVREKARKIGRKILTDKAQNPGAGMKTEEEIESWYEEEKKTKLDRLLAKFEKKQDMEGAEQAYRVELDRLFEKYKKARLAAMENVSKRPGQHSVSALNRLGQIIRELLNKS